MSRSKSLGSWKAPSRSGTSSSIRGKISNPIPMTDDDEFPIRTPGAGIATTTPLGTEGLHRQLHIPPPISDSSPAIQEGNYNSEPIGTAVTTNSRSGSDASRIDEFHAPTSSYNGYESAYMRDSLASQKTPRGSGSGTETPSRKKSTLKSVVRRLFGRKRKSDASGSTRNTVDNRRAEQHRSDPTALTRNISSRALSPKRSASLPINDFNRALSSHSPFPDNPSQNTEHIEQAHDESSTGQRGRQRSATTSRLYNPHKSASYEDWAGLTPRPASQHVRGSKIYSEEEGDAIGYAITSGSHPNRRSRSLSHLREAAQGQTERRRSDEIRYWRESYDVDPLSPAPSKPDIEVENKDQTDHEKLEPFNFGAIHSEMAGMKITKAVGLEERVSHLENRFLRMEKRLSHAPHRSSITLQDAQKSRSGRARSGSKHSQTNGSSTGSHSQTPSLDQRPSLEAASISTTQSSLIEDFSPPPTFLTSPEHSPHIAHDRDAAYNRLSSSTVTPKSKFQPSHLNIEHYHTLLALITREQTLRQRLEAQVLSLKGQVRDLQSESMGVKHKAYPTPSPENSGRDGGRGRETSEHSSFDDSDDEEDEAGFDGGDVYQTPMEERCDEGFEDGVVHLRKDRTLSLSQLTMGRGVC